MPFPAVKENVGKINATHLRGQIKLCKPLKGMGNENVNLGGEIGQLRSLGELNDEENCHVSERYDINP